MRYIGGKSRIAKQVSETILRLTSSRGDYIEPFIGGGAIFAKMSPHFARPAAGDVNYDLVLMWNAVFNDGWIPPEVLSRQDWEALRHSEPSPLRAFAGFGCSFGSKWFRGYAQSNTKNGNPRNHAAEARRGLLRVAESVERPVTILCRDYKEWSPSPGSVIYCDPPYSTGGWDSVTDGAYGSSNFNIGEFWKVASAWRDSGCHVFVSEYSAPIGWSCVWSGEKIVSLKSSSNSIKNVERLFC